MISMTEAFLIALAMGSISSFIAIQRKKSPISWFFAGFVFGLPGVIFTFFAPKIQSKIKLKKTSLPFKKLKKTSTPPAKKIDRRLWFYLDKEHKQVGPMSINALREDWLTKKISPSTFVWHDKLESWKKINQLSDFEELFYGKKQNSKEKITN